MSKSYQHEIPTARVNITLDVETNGAQIKKELPMKMLMIGNYSYGQAKGAIGEREKIDVNKHNFNQAIESMAPQLNLEVGNKLSNEEESFPVNLTFRSMDDFKPEQIIEQIPQLQKLMAMRNLLKDLKASIIDNKTFRKALETILMDVNGKEQLLADLSSQSPLQE